MLLFIRSEEKERITLSIVSIHLMLLFIEAAGRGRNRQGQVSIHLMLLFIWVEYLKGQCMDKFQYISCCYLSSVNRKASESLQCVSIHLMLLFINFAMCGKTIGSFVSIHLMLLFILQANLTRSMQRCFNTSHVVIYRRLRI